jgi:uncharacterized RDD family membrane protein YckC
MDPGAGATPPPPPPPGGWGNQPAPPPPPGAYGAPGGYAAGGTPSYNGIPLASWGQRVGAYLIDYFVPFVPSFILFRVAPALGVLLWLAGFAFIIWNLVQQGNTGQTIGKKQLGIRLVREADGQPVGAGLSIGRYFVHIIDAIPCYVGFLFPLWDAKRQTFADKILSTVVIQG